MVKHKNKKMVNKIVTAYKYGDSLELTSALGSSDLVMMKLNKDSMVNKVTGEIVDVHHITSRADPENYVSLRHTFKQLRRLIGTNFRGGKSELWITLTYKTKMTDPQKLYSDFKQFIKRIRKLTKRYIAYIVIIEPQASGSFHAHLLLKTLDDSHLYISNKDCSEAWRQGFVNVRRLKNTDNVSSYVMAYVTDVDLNNLDDSFDSKRSKKIIKGGRLSLYPIGMQIYRRSRKGIKDPIKMKGMRDSIKKDIGIDNADPQFYSSFNIQEKSGEKMNIETEFYSIREAKLQLAIEKVKNLKNKKAKHTRQDNA